MNLSVTELVMASTGNPILSYNSFLQSWSFSETICRINALGMTYLGMAVNFAAAPKETPTVQEFSPSSRWPSWLCSATWWSPGINSFHYQPPAPPSSLWSSSGSTPPSCHFLLSRGLALLVSTLLVWGAYISVYFIDSFESIPVSQGMDPM